MRFALEFLTIITVGVLPNLYAALLDIRNPDYLKKAELFSVFETLPSTWLSAMSSIFVVLLVAYQQPNRFLSIGLRSGQWGNNIIAVLIGYFGLVVFAILFAVGQKLFLLFVKQASPLTVDTSNPWVTSNLRYQDNWERLANLTVLPFSAISEDLIYRGYFILYLGRLTNTFIPWAVISIFIMVLIHLYQGKNTRIIIYHFLLACLFTGLTIATQNILAPITAHIVFNFMNKLKLWNLEKKHNQTTSMTVKSNKKKLAYALFIVANITIFVVSTIIVLA